MNELITALNKLATELRKKEVSYTKCDKLRLKIDDLNKEYHYQFDEMLYRKISNICYNYHNNDMENRHTRYLLIGNIYDVIDLMKDENY